MITYKITGIQALQDKLDAIGKKTVKMATAAALKDTAFDARAGVQYEMGSEFDKPTPWTISTVRVDIEKAKSDLVASVGLTRTRGGGSDTWQIPAYAGHEVSGGERKAKGAEWQLRRKGILPRDLYIAPAKDAFLDRFGNIGPELVRILSSLNAFDEVSRSGLSYRMNKTLKSRGKKKDRYFVMKKDGRPIGIWERKGIGNAIPVLMFIRTPHYKPRIKFYKVARDVVSNRFIDNFKRRIKEYLSYSIK